MSYSATFNATNNKITIASGHSLTANTKVKFGYLSLLDAGLSLDDVYLVKNPDATTLELINAVTGYGVDITQNGSGTLFQITSYATGNTYDIEGMVEFDSNEEDDYPDPPRNPKRALSFDQTVGTKRPLEKLLKNNRIRFNWDEPNEEKESFNNLTPYQRTKYASSTTIINEHLSDDASEGLSPGQTDVAKYKIIVQEKVSGGSWQTVETDKTSDTFYVFQADPDVKKPLNKYRAKIWSIDRNGNKSNGWLNSNTGNQVYASDENSNGIGFGDGLSAPTDLSIFWDVTEKKTKLEYHINAEWTAPVAVATAITATLDSATDFISPNFVGFINNDDKIQFTSLSGGAGLSTSVSYFVVNASESSFQLSTTSGGSVKTFTSDGTGTFTVTSSLQPAQYDVRAQAFNSASINDPVLQGTNSNKKVIYKKIVQAPVQGDSTDPLTVNLGKAINPNKWFWAVRIRSADINGNYGSWSNWTTPAKPSADDSLPIVPPPKIDSVTFTTDASSKNNKHTLKVVLQPVTYWDIPGGDKEDDMARYIVQVQTQSRYSGDTLKSAPVSTQWIKLKTKQVEDKDDGEAKEDIVIYFKQIHRSNFYRVRARSVDRFNRRGPWSNNWVYTGRSADGAVGTSETIGSGTWSPSPGYTFLLSNNNPLSVPSGFAITQKRTGPLSVQWDWDDIPDHENDRYKVIIYGRSAPTASWIEQDVFFPRQSFLRYSVPKTKKDWKFKAKIYAQTDVNSGGNADSGGNYAQNRIEVLLKEQSDATADGVDNQSGGGATEPPIKPVTPTAQRKIKSVILHWEKDENNQPSGAQPVVYEVHAKKSSVSSWPTNTDLTKVGHTQGTSYPVKKYWSGSGTGPTDFVKGDFAFDFNFRLIPKSKIDETFEYGPASESVSSKPARTPLGEVGTDKPDAPTNLTRTVVGPRKIRWDWDESKDPSVDRYKIVIKGATSSTANFAPFLTKFPRHSFFVFDIVDDAKLSWYWKADVYAQTSPQDDTNATRVDSNVLNDPAGSSQASDFVGKATIPPTPPTNITVQRRPRKMVVRWHHEPTEAMGNVKYLIHIIKSSSSFTPSSSTKVGQVPDANVYPATQYSSGGTLVDFIKRDSKSTFAIIVVAKNSKGEARSVAFFSQPASSMVANSKDDLPDTGDVYTIQANRFIADDTATVDRIIIADDDNSKASIKFSGRNGNTIFTVRGNGGNVEVINGFVQFSAGIVLPYRSAQGTPQGATGFPNQPGAIGVGENRLWWLGASGWRWVNFNEATGSVAGGTG